MNSFNRFYLKKTEKCSKKHVHDSSKVYTVQTDVWFTGKACSSLFIHFAKFSTWKCTRKRHEVGTMGRIIFRVSNFPSVYRLIAANVLRIFRTKGNKNKSVNILHNNSTQDVSNLLKRKWKFYVVYKKRINRNLYHIWKCVHRKKSHLPNEIRMTTAIST